jgi:hypothetical protein
VRSKHMPTKVAIVAATSLVGQAMSTVEASANPVWVSGNGPDSYDHYVLFTSSLLGYSYNGIANGVNELDRSHLALNVNSNNWIDVTAVRADTTPNAGSFACNQQSSPPYPGCNLSTVRLSNQLDTGVNIAYWKALGCHEIGHSGGLGERPYNDNSCERSPTDDQHYVLGSDDVSLVNQFWP